MHGVTATRARTVSAAAVVEIMAVERVVVERFAVEVVEAGEGGCGGCGGGVEWWSGGPPGSMPSPRPATPCSPVALPARPAFRRDSPPFTRACSQGDKRTAKGKRRAGTHGVCRPTNAELRIRREGPMSPAASPPASPPAPPPAPAPAAPAPAPPPAPPPAPEPEPEPAAAAPAAAMSAGELMKLVKALKAELPRAEMKQCKQALEATGGDVAAAKSAIEGEMASAWAAEDEAKAISIKEGSTVRMPLIISP